MKPYLEQLRRYVDLRTLWVIPIGSIFLVAGAFSPLAPLFDKPVLEAIAIPLAGAAWLASLYRLYRVRSPFFVILCYLTFALFMREIHFSGAKAFCYASLVIVFLWAWVWREKIQCEIHDRKLMSWLFTTFAAYAWSQFVARKGLEFIPNELSFHEALEEGSENLGHLLMLITCCVGDWTPFAKRSKQEEINAPSSSQAD